MNPLPWRGGVFLGLLLTLQASALGQLSPPTTPAANPLTKPKVTLGKILFWDEQLSSDNTTACGTCHEPRFGGSASAGFRHPGPDGLLATLDDSFGSEGVLRSDSRHNYKPDPVSAKLEPQVTRRFPGTVVGAGYFDSLLWDGSAEDVLRDPDGGEVVLANHAALEVQSLLPLLSPAEMAKEQRTWTDLTEKLAYVEPLHLATDLPGDLRQALAVVYGYPELFDSAFGDPAITPTRIAMALAAYQRSLVSDQTPFDLQAADRAQTLKPQLGAGQALFFGKAGCATCHPAPLFSDGEFHNIGLRLPPSDAGRGAITGLPQDQGRFRTPTLRNVGLRSRFMHNGSLASLEEVVEFYDRGGDSPLNRDSLMVPLNLSNREKSQLVAFLRQGLTDPRVEQELAPFDRPTLHTTWRTEETWLYGVATAGSGGFIPEVVARSPPSIGSDHFKIGLKNALGGTFAVMGIGEDRLEPPLYFGSIPFQLSVSPWPRLHGHVLRGFGPGQGYATTQAVIPRDAAYIGLPYTVQWFVLDPAAAGGWAASRGAHLFVF